MLRSKEFYFSFLVTAALLFVPLLLSLFTFFRKDLVYVEPAYYYWGAAGMGYSWGGDDLPNTYLNALINEVFCSMCLPFVASLSYAYRMFDDRKSGAMQVIVPRVGYRTYCFGVVTVTFLGGFLTVFLPFVLEQLVLLVACPFDVPFMISNLPFEDTYLDYYGNAAGGALSALLLNHPYVYNFLFCLLPAVLAGLFGTLSAALSLYLVKSRFLTLTLVGILWIVLSFVTGALYFKWNVGMAAVSNGNFTLYPIVAGALLLADALLLFGAFRRKDVGL